MGYLNQQGFELSQKMQLIPIRPVADIGHTSQAGMYYPSFELLRILVLKLGSKYSSI